MADPSENEPGDVELGDGAHRDAPGDPLADVRETVRRLVEPEGCAWHDAQTHASLVPFLIEETAEFIDAVERGLPAGRWPANWATSSTRCSSTRRSPNAMRRATTSTRSRRR
ncbi:nucleoside triphosphate pyrophosphohydrolase family protein [Leucobacter soli]|uniref:hypothetical protein n=1 Tax=Leucobacter soli TaxID=2812850 RepID=UPI003613F453